MSWGYIERNETLSIGEDAAADVCFLEIYCSERMIERILVGGIVTADARRVLHRLTELVPDGDHTSPTWNGRPQPFVVVGSAQLKQRAGRPPVAEVKSPRFGICVHEGAMHVWAPRNLVVLLFGQQALADGPWVAWRSGEGVVRHSASVGGSRRELDDRTHPLNVEPLRSLLAHVQAHARAAHSAGRHQDLLEVLRPCREELGHEPGFDVVYPRLVDQLDDCNGDLGAETDEPLAPLVPPDGGTTLDSPGAIPAGAAAPELQIQRAAGAPSMLRIVRDVAIARVVGAGVPHFDDAALDRWIMATGYPGLPRPHTEAADLLGTYAASLANAGGRKPEAVRLGQVVRGAASGLRDPADPGRISRAFADRGDLASLCTDHLGSNPLGGDFDTDMRSIAAGHAGRRVLAGLLLIRHECS